MHSRTYSTAKGTIHYWVSGERFPEKPALVFLPGLTADHRLFDKQIEYFKGKYTVLVWDAPGHGLSRPFELDFSLMTKALWLHEILAAEGIEKPVLVGQSMGGYVGQAYLQRYPGSLRGFVSIDSAPLQRSYVSGWEIWLLKKMEPVYKYYPWKWLLSSGTKGVATTAYGQKLMEDMMHSFDGRKAEYAALSGNGFRMLAEAMEADLPYAIDCPAALICGTEDKAGSAKAYNRKWAAKTGLPMHWIRGAGHNANTDDPEQVNAIIEEIASQGAMKCSVGEKDE